MNARTGNHLPLRRKPKSKFKKFREKTAAVWSGKDLFDHRCSVRLLTVLILSALVISPPLSAHAENTCGPIEVCPEWDDCKPSKDCKTSAKPDCKSTYSLFGTHKDSDCNTEVGSEASLAIASCETEQAAQLATCRALQADKKAACKAQQTRQLSQCQSSSTKLKVPNLCEDVNSLLASSKKRFDDVKGQAEDSVGDTKYWRATKTIIGMRECVVVQGGGTTYYGCTVVESSDATKVVSMMFGLSAALSNCLGTTEVHRFVISDSAVNSFWVHFINESRLDVHARNLGQWLLFFDVNSE
jgi:hypothetical protein